MRQDVEATERRYVEIQNAPPLRKEQVRRVAAYYPLNDNAAVFECFDEKVNASRAMRKHTMNMVSFIDGDWCG